MTVQADIVDAIPVTDVDVAATSFTERPDQRISPSLSSLVELLLKDQPGVDLLCRTADGQRELVPKLLAVGLAGYLLFGAVLVVAFQLIGVWPEPHSIANWLAGEGPMPIEVREDTLPWWSRWLNGSAIILLGSFALGLIGAIGVCLPSFYFYGLLAGVRTTMLHVTAHALKGLAAGAVALVGLLPLYLAAVLALAVFPAPQVLVVPSCLFGFALPFVAGLWGTRSLYLGFVCLSDTMGPEQRVNRECFLRRLIVAWSACYTAVAPLMVFSVWDWLS